MPGVQKEFQTLKGSLQTFFVDMTHIFHKSRFKPSKDRYKPNPTVLDAVTNISFKPSKDRYKLDFRDAWAFKCTLVSNPQRIATNMEYCICIVFIYIFSFKPSKDRYKLRYRFDHFFFLFMFQTLKGSLQTELEMNFLVQECCVSNPQRIATNL